MANLGDRMTGFFGGLSGGSAISGTPYGSFFDSTSQTASPINTAVKVLIRNTNIATSNVVLSNSQISVTQAGVYSVIASFQIDNNAGATHSVNTWFQQGNGVGASSIVSNSNHIFTLTNGLRIVGMMEGFFNLAVNDYLEVYWSVSNTGISLVATGTQVSPTRPATPCVSFEINRIS